MIVHNKGETVVVAAEVAAEEEEMTMIEEEDIEVHMVVINKIIEEVDIEADLDLLMIEEGVVTDIINVEVQIEEINVEVLTEEIKVEMIDIIKEVIQEIVKIEIVVEMKIKVEEEEEVQVVNHQDKIEEDPVEMIEEKDHHHQEALIHQDLEDDIINNQYEILYFDNKYYVIFHY